jgi:hypothetical protein
MIGHQRAFLSSSSVVPEIETPSDAVISPDGRDSVNGFLINSPDAISNEVLVLLPSGAMGEEENQGKKRDEVVDSSLLRDVAEDGISKLKSGRSELPSSSRVVRCRSEGLRR